MIQQTVHRILLGAFVGVKGSMVFHTIFTDRTRSVSTLGAAFGEPGRECKKIGLSSQGVTTDTSKRKRTDYLWAQIRTSAIGNRHTHTHTRPYTLTNFVATV